MTDVWFLKICSENERKKKSPNSYKKCPHSSTHAKTTCYCMLTCSNEWFIIFSSIVSANIIMHRTTKYALKQCLYSNFSSFHHNSSMCFILPHDVDQYGSVLNYKNGHKCTGKYDSWLQPNCLTLDHARWAINIVIKMI